MDIGNKIKHWRENPAAFAYDNFKIELDEWQKDGLMPCGGPLTPRRRVSFKACTGPGKSAILAIIGWHRLACFAEKGEHPKGAAISGEGRDNLRDNLWAELSKWQQRSEFLKSAFTWTKERIFAKDHHETWFLSARGYAQDADTEAIGHSLSGLHSKYPFILLDETGKMPIAVGQKSSQIFTGGVVDGLIGSAGNPTDTSGLLYQIHTNEADLWNLITITADPDDPKRTPRVDIDHAREQIKKYGRDNPWVMATILGMFPPGGFNSLLSIEDVEKAMNRRIVESDYAYSQKRIGVDVARFGDDDTVLFPRQGLLASKPAVMKNARSNEIAARVTIARSRWMQKGTHDVLELVDGTGGYGSGVIDSLIQYGLSPMEVNFSGKALDPRYFNKRSEMWFEMAEWVKRGGCLPNDPQLKRELTAPQYILQNGKFRLEEKDQIRKRLGFSPDKADALALTFALPDQPAAVITPYGQHQAGKMLSEYDPYGEERQ